MKMPVDVQTLKIEPAAPADVSAISDLLREAGLPHENVAPHIATFFVARSGGVPVGAVGSEPCGRDALLRSLVVAPALRGTGIGGRLVDELERAAGAWGVERWWLLTNTAERFFAVRGFAKVPRESAPPAIRATKQFDGHGCGSAVCMTRARQEVA